MLGKICDEDLDVVHKVGLKAKEAIFMTKEELHIEISRIEEIPSSTDPTYTHLLGSYGMRKLRRFSVEFRELIEEGKLAKEEFTYLIDALIMYTNMMAQWAYFYYPWGIGCACYRFEDGYRTYRPE